MMPIVMSWTPPINMIPTNKAAQPVTQYWAKNIRPSIAYKTPIKPTNADVNPRYIEMRRGLVEKDVMPSSAKFIIFENV